MSLGRDILDNFDTWPQHIQSSFLEIVSNQALMDAQMERLANLSYLEQVFDDFKAVLTVFDNRTHSLIEEIHDDIDSAKFLETLAEREEMKGKITDLIRQLHTLEEIFTEVK